MSLAPHGVQGHDFLAYNFLSNKTVIITDQETFGGTQFSLLHLQTLEAGVQRGELICPRSPSHPYRLSRFQGEGERNKESFEILGRKEAENTQCVVTLSL